jgi:hypothetical protein
LESLKQCWAGTRFGKWELLVPVQVRKIKSKLDLIFGTVLETENQFLFLFWRTEPGTTFSVPFMCGTGTKIFAKD